MDFVWIFCCQIIWITQASNLEITKKNYGNTDIDMSETSLCSSITRPFDDPLPFESYITLFFFVYMVSVLFLTCQSNIVVGGGGGGRGLIKYIFVHYSCMPKG